MASIPLPALDVKPPEQQNPIDSLGRIVALKAALQNQQYQQQQQPLELQARQNELQQQNMSLASQKAMQKAYTEANGDPDQTIHLAAKYGALPGDLQKFQMATADYKQKLATTNKDQLANINTGADNLGGVLKPIADIPDPQKQAFAWQQAKQSIVQEYQQDPQKAALRYGMPDPSQIPDYPGPDGVKLFTAHLQGVKAQVEQATAAQTAAAHTLTAQTGASEFAAKQNPQSPLFSPTPAAVAMGQAPGTKEAQAGQISMAGKEAGAKAAAEYPYQQGLVSARAAVDNQFWNDRDARGKVETQIFKPYQEKMQSVQELNSAVDQANAGNIAAARGVLLKLIGVSNPDGTKRYNSQEAARLSSMGSVPQRFQGTVQGLLTGNEWTPTMARDIKAFGDAQAQVATTSANSAIDNINTLHGTKIGHLDAPKSAPNAGPPPGATMKVPGSDGKLHWSDGKQDLGVASQ